ncbi:MAG: hypothetical protein HQK65_12610 [Desulfamplus sp.]|nr:hypothetical protein [Desulfamplus sp.]
MPYPEFDRDRLHLAPLSERIHDLDIASVLPLQTPPDIHPVLRQVAVHLAAAQKNSAARIFMMGAHVIRSGVQHFLINLMERGAISLIAMNGAGVIHDFELALIGKTTESVARYIATGQFGLWQETGRINDIVRQGAKAGLGLGEAVGQAILHGNYPHKYISLLARAAELGIPVTVHVGIGQDITHEHPNFDGAAYGQASYRDFLRFVSAMENVNQGVVMNFGSAVAAPEVYLKALAMARNVALQDGRTITDFTTLVCDLQELPTGEVGLEPDKADPRYYFRPWKTMLSRTVAQGGRGYYYRGVHAESIPQLWAACLEAMPIQKLNFSHH